jgi:hypothetical protein
MASVTNLRLLARPLFVVVTLGACSPDLTLLNDGSSFGGIDGGGEASTSGGDDSAGGALSGGGPSMAGQTTNMHGGGDGGELNTLGAGGEAGSAGAASVCEPAPETCNAEDDDCNGVIDDGCPSGVTTTYDKDLPALGDSPNGTAFADDCQHGQVLGGVKLRMGAFLAQIQGVCRTAELKLKLGSPLGYTLSLSSEAPLAAHPDTGEDTVTTLSCPTNEALVGVRISEQHATLANEASATVIPVIWISCAKLVLVEQGGQLSVTWKGLKELAPASGSLANGTAWFASTVAPGGLVPTRLHGAASSWIDRGGIGGSRVEIVR